MVANGAVVTAGRVANMFKLDPVAVLAEDDPWLWAVRVAAHNVVMADREKAHAARNQRPGVTPSTRGRRRGH